MKKYTVILLYPEYMSEEFGHETYMTCVSAGTPSQAVALAREEMEDLDTPTDAFVIAVIEGDHEDLNPER